MVFGYLNRNYEEEVDIPLGPDNSITVGGEVYGDRGQPTHFYPQAAAIPVQSGRAQGLGQDGKGGVDADFARANRPGQGMAPAGMGTERRT